jgi:predicted nucleotide-binding protein (sugar kinase/HSP70/actin superfamily)
MTYIGARFFSAVFRSIGIDAHPTPASNDRTLELGGLYTSGEECYPEKITLGDFLRVLEADGFDPKKTAFFMPTADGPCRFGQYAPYLRHVLDEMGHSDIPVISPTSKNGYDGLGDGTGAIEMVRSLWRSLVAGDILRKMMLKTRPYETDPGTTDKVYEQSIDRVEEVIAARGLSSRARINEMAAVLTECRDKFRAIPACYTPGRPLIGVVGEIFCRLNTFSNYDAIRKIEQHGGECWLSDIGEWVWYTNWSQKSLLKRDGKQFSFAMLGALVKNKVQRSDEQKLFAPFKEDFVGYKEPHDIYHEVLKPAWPYLPADGALGEMVLSVGKSIYLYDKGADGIIDISPFSCMNGIVTEAVYHDVSRDYDRLPIRNFYFDASSSNMERDLDIFMELASSYQERKKTKRTYPAYFEK